MEFSNIRDFHLRVPFESAFTLKKILYSSKILSFNMELQIKSNWCWSATAKSVSHFYSSLLNPWTQCKIAAAELGLSCCNTPTPNGCNVPWYLDRALSRTQNYASMASGTLSWEAVKAQLDQGLVVGARIGWSGGGGHFMVIYGVSKIGSIKYFHIDDPIYGKSVLTVANFNTNYQGSGTWTHHYFTKKHFYIMWINRNISRALLNPVPQIRPLLKMELPQLNIDKNIEEIEFAMPHQVFNLGLKDIGKEIKMPTTPSCVRVFELDNQQPVVAFDLSANESAPEVMQVHTDKAYMETVEEGIELLKQRSADRKDEMVLNLLKIPALNLEALWLKGTAKNADLFYLVRNASEANGVLSQAEFNAIVIRQKALVERQDDTMGA